MAHEFILRDSKATGLGRFGTRVRGDVCVCKGARGAHRSDLVHVDDDRCARTGLAVRRRYESIVLRRAKLVHST